MHKIGGAVDRVDNEGGFIAQFDSRFPRLFAHEAECGIARKETFGDEEFYLFVCFGDLRGMSEIMIGAEAACIMIGGHLVNRVLLTRSAEFFLSSKSSLVDVLERRDSEAARIMTPASRAIERRVEHIEGRSIEFQTQVFAGCEDILNRGLWSCECWAWKRKRPGNGGGVTQDRR